MSTLKLSVLSYYLLLGNCVLSIIVDQGPSSIGGVLQSYADALSTVQPSEEIRGHSSSNRTTKYPQLYESGMNHVNIPLSTPQSPNKSTSLTTTRSTAEPIWADTKTVSHKKSEESLDGLTEEREDYSRDPEEPPDHVIPFSEHENPAEPSTRPNYTAPGVWARPPPNKNISLDFVPTKLYAQVRGTHTISHVPKEEALKSAETDEEKANAARLREVVKVSKANTVYTEEGYEDAAYDHAAQMRDADFHEGFARKLNEEGRKGSPKTNIKRKSKKNRKRKPQRNRSRSYDDLNDDYSDHREVKGERDTLKKAVQPRDLERLKYSLGRSKIDPKRATMGGILQLEKDLMKESDEVSNLSSLQSSHSMINETVVTQPTATTEHILELTTVNDNVFTVRPKKPETSVQTYYNTHKFRRPTEYHPLPENNIISNSQSGLQFYKNLNSANTMTTSTSFSQSLPVERFESSYKVPITTYHPLLPGSQNIDTIIASPLAVATLNGHGPYLVVVTSPSSILTSEAPRSQETTTTMHYISPSGESRTESSEYSSIQHKSPVSTFPKHLVHSEVNHPSQPIASDIDRMTFSDSADKRGDIYLSRNPENTRIDLTNRRVLGVLSDGDGVSKNRYGIPSTSPRHRMFVSHQSPKLSRDTIRRRISLPSGNMKQIAVKERGVTRAQYPQSDQELQMREVPATKLLPPPPLSSSEYATFQRGMNGEPVPPLLMSLVPVIEDIHRREFETFPFLFRKKRSAIDPNYQWRLKSKDKHSRNNMKSHAGRNHTNSRSQSARDNYPKKFVHLLSESPKVATQMIDSEIQSRFVNESRKNNSLEAVSDNAARDNGSKESLEASEEELSNEAHFSELDSNDDSEEVNESPINQVGVDDVKYPFYTGSSNTALKYMVNPLAVPHKTLGGMEFYNSRYRKCEDVDPNLEELVPPDDELDGKLGPRGGKRRLEGLGSKLDCYKAKYFDEDPLDNPLFSEKSIQAPPAPPELDPYRFASRISGLPPRKDEYIIPRGPKSPEDLGKQKVSNIGMSKRYKESNGRNFPPSRASKNGMRSQSKNNRGYQNEFVHGGYEKKPKKTRHRNIQKSKRSQVTPEYQRQVYEDVMGTIMNQGRVKRGPFHHVLNSKPYSRHTHHGRDWTRDGHGLEQRGQSTPHRRLTPLLQSNDRQSINERSQWIKLHPKNNSPWSRNLSHKMSKRSVTTEILEENMKSPEATTSTHLTNENIDTTTVVSESLISQKRKKKRKPPVLMEKVEKIHDENEALRLADTDSGKYGKFQGETGTLLDKTRRNEPRYYVPKRRILIPVNSTNSSLPPANISSLDNPPLFEAAASSSTLIPVIVKPEPDPARRELQRSGSKTARVRLKQSPAMDEGGDTKNNGPTAEGEEITVRTVTDKDDGLTNSHPTKDNADNHPTLTAFLEGDPPGYTKAFNDDKSSRSTVDRSENDNHNARNEGKSIEESDESMGEDDSGEKYVGESTSDDAREQSIENMDNQKTHNPPRGDDKRFEQYSDRPDSPPENYEDEKYSDLGPRINKPYFYHPPFEVPDYEKFKLEALADDESADTSGSGETRNNEQYAGASRENTENEDSSDDEEEASESRKTHLNRYEYPWERRGRDHKKKQRREQYSSAASREDEDEEATLTRPIYVALKDVNNHSLEGMNNAHALQGNSQSRFRNKLKSGTLAVPLGDEELIVTVANNEDIRKSIVGSLLTDGDHLVKAEENTHQKNIRGNTRKLTPNNKDDQDQYKQVNPPVRAGAPTPRDYADTSVPNATKSQSPMVTTMKDNSTPLRSQRRGKTSNIDLVTKDDQTRSYLQSSQNQNPSLIRKMSRRRNISQRETDSSTSAPTHLNQRRRIRPVGDRTISEVMKSRNTQKDSSSLPSTRGRMKYHSPKAFSNMSKPGTNSPNSTGRTVEHHSRVSKQEIITKTIYPDDDETGEREDLSNDGQVAATHVGYPSLILNRRRALPKDGSQKKEKIEKVTITMEETPERVYKTEEIDRDGVKGKFFTIIPNNKSSITRTAMDVTLSTERNPHVINKTLNISEVNSNHRNDDGLHKIDSGAMPITQFQGAPVRDHPKSQLLQDPGANSTLSNTPVAANEEIRNDKEQGEAENEDEDEDEDDQDDDVEDNDDEEDSDESEENRSIKEEKQKIANYSNGGGRESIRAPSNDTQIESVQVSQNMTEIPVVNIVKDPNQRQYYYVE